MPPVWWTVWWAQVKQISRRFLTSMDLLGVPKLRAWPQLRQSIWLVLYREFWRTREFTIFQRRDSGGQGYKQGRDRKELSCWENCDGYWPRIGNCIVIMRWRLYILAQPSRAKVSHLLLGRLNHPLADLNSIRCSTHILQTPPHEYLDTKLIWPLLELQCVAFFAAVSRAQTGQFQSLGSPTLNISEPEARPTTRLQKR